MTRASADSVFPGGTAGVGVLFPDMSSPIGGETLPRFHQRTVPALLMGQVLSSPHANAAAAWASQFPQSSVVYWVVPVEARQASEGGSPLPSTAEQLSDIQGFFGLSKSQLANACRVRRQTIYDWYAGKFEAEGRNSERLLALHELATQIRASGVRPLSAKLTRRKRGDGMDLASLLAKEHVEPEAVRSLVGQLAEGTTARRERGAAALRRRLGWQPVDEEAKRETLASNLDELDG